MLLPGGVVLGGVRAAQREIGHWLAVVGIVNAVVGVLMGLLLWTLGLPNPTLWGVLTAVFCFVPYIGPMALAGLLLLAAALQHIIDSERRTRLMLRGANDSDRAATP